MTLRKNIWKKTLSKQNIMKKAESSNDFHPLLVVGSLTKSGFKLTKKIETLDEFWYILNKDKSLFAKHRMYPTAFFMSWQIKLIKKWIDAGWFFTAYR